MLYNVTLPSSSVALDGYNVPVMLMLQRLTSMLLGFESSYVASVCVFVGLMGCSKS